MNVVKIGGSVLFDSNGDFKEEVFSGIYSRLSDDSIIVIGCGKKMHDLVINDQLTDDTRLDDVKDIEKRRKAFSEIRDELQERLLFIEKKFKIKSIFVEDLFVKSSKGDKSSHEICEFHRELINGKFITSGGLVADESIEHSAISSDTIAAFLAEEFNSERMILVSDVDGVLDIDGKVIEELNVEDREKHGLKGGMLDKLRRIKNGLNSNIEIFVVNGYYPQRISNILSREKNICSKIKLK